MADTYFEYTLAQCRFKSIMSICAVCQTRKELLEKAYKGFNGCKNITDDWRIIKAVKNCFENNQLLNPTIMDSDAREVYDRCYDSIYLKEKLSYDQLFDVLVDINWVLAGIHNSNICGNRTVRLQSNHGEYIKSIKDFLLTTYISAAKDNNECVYINEALKAKGMIFSGLYQFKHEESRFYTSSDFTSSELQDFKQQHREKSCTSMALFYGLTATAALAENIRRGC